MKGLVFYEEVSYCDRRWKDFHHIGQLKRFISLPPYPALFFSNAEWLRRSNEILSGTVRLDENRTLNIEEISWMRDPLAGTFSVSRLLFHALEWVEGLIYAYQHSDRSEYLTCAKRLTFMWLKECLHREGTGNIWSDHGTALRAVVLCRLWLVCHSKETDDLEFMNHLVAGIIRHGEKLSHPLFYRRDHNHGVAQAYALFVLGVVFSQHSLGVEWINLGMTRLEAQMEENVSSEGVHREHSPYYHFFVFRHFGYAYYLGESQGIKFSSAFIRRLQDMLRSGVHFVKPNGSMWAFGDTSISSPVLFEEMEGKDLLIQPANELLYCLSKGREGRMPDNSSVLFPNGGFCSLRSGWGNREELSQERCVAIRMGTFPTTHIHRDVGTFELYGYGDDLIVDSGGPYAYGHPIRGEYFLATRAHNTVMVDGQDQGIGQSSIINWKTTEQFDFLQMEHETYPGTTHNRSFIFVRPNYFIILDQLHSHDVHCYSQLFHLNERLHIVLQHMVATTENRFGGPTVRIVPFFKNGLGVRVHLGSFRPLQGWRCLSEKSMVPNATLEYQQEGSSVQFGVLIIPEPPNHPQETQVEVGSGESSPGLNLKVQVENRLDQILLPPSGNLTIEQISL